MSRFSYRCGVSALSLAASSLAVAAAVSGPAYAQDQVRRFDIPAQPLSSALMEYSRQSDVVVVVPTSVVEGKSAPQLQGAFTPNDALARLLAGSGLSPRQTADGGLTLVQTTPSPTPLGAPNRAASSVLDESEIVVTAQKREQAISDVPQSLQAFSGRRLEDQGVTDLGQLITQIPSAAQGSGGDPAARQYTIRGVGSLFGDPTVSYYIDEASFAIPSVAGGSNTAPPASLWDLDRVEALRGPQGTLYGQGAIGGMIRFISAEPDLQDTVIRGQVSGSDTDGGDPNGSASLAVSIPVQRDVFAIRASGDYQERGGYIEVTDFPGRENLDDYTSQTYRLSALLTPTEDWRFRLSYIRNENEFFSSGALVSTDPPLATQGTDAALNSALTSYDMLSLFGSYDAGPFTVESGSGYIDYNRDTIAYFSFFGFPLATAGESPAEVFTQEVRLVSNGEGPLHWILGGYYQDSTAYSNFVLSGVINADSVSRVRSEARALFGELSYDFLGGKLTPLIGGRWFEDDRAYRSADSFGSVSSDSATFDTFNPRFNLSYRPSDGALLYFNAAKGFRSGNFNLPLSIAIVGPGGYGLPIEERVDPDSLWSYEIGGKWSLLDGALDVGAAIYHWRWSDLQVTVNPTGLAGAMLNTGEAESTGLELEFLWRTPLDGLTVSGNANINENEFTELLPAVANIPNDGISLGGRVPFTPERTASVSADYRFPLGAGNIDGRILGTYSYAGDIVDVSSGAVSDDHHLLSARFGVENDHWGAFVFGDNLLNDDGPIYAQRNAAGDFLTRNYPRVVGVQLTFDY